MSKKFLQKKFDEIIEFAELERFVDLPLKNFSSGMQVRLAFSIAFKSEADVYILDEVLAVGDINFQEKSLNVFKSLKKNRKTVVLVSHSLSMIEEYCDRVAYMKNGELIDVGPAKEIVAEYKAQNA